MSVFGDRGLAAWLRAEIEADRRDASVKVIRQHWRADPGSWDAGTGIIGEDGGPVAVAIGDYAARHIVRHDPPGVLADCEAKLAVLDLYEKQAAKEFDNAMEEDRTWTLAPVVRLLGYGYRFRPGYREAEWKP